MFGFPACSGHCETLLRNVSRIFSAKVGVFEIRIGQFLQNYRKTLPQCRYSLTFLCEM